MNKGLTKEKILEKILKPKICSYCKEIKQYEELCKRAKFKETEIYYTFSYCKKCRNKKREERRKNNLSESRKKSNNKRANKYRINNKEKIKENYCPIKAKNKRLKNQYGIDLNWFNQKLIENNFKCFICNNTINHKTGVVDHCHKTGKIRDVICNKCNTAIGLLKENEESFFRAVEYLKKFNN